MKKVMEFIEDWKLKTKEKRELKALHRLRDDELRVMKEKQKFEIEKETLQGQLGVEEVKAKIRKQQQTNVPKQGTVLENKSGFAKFQDYATNFANNSPNILGETNLGLEQRPKKRKRMNGIEPNPMLEPTIKL